MNKPLIESLAAQSLVYQDTGLADGRELVFSTQKFSELIVRECIEVALNERVAEEEIDKSDDIEDRCYLRGNNGGIVDSVVAIKQHFGVDL